MATVTVKAIRIERQVPITIEDATEVNNISWAAAEDALNDQLPDGYYAKIEDV